MPFLLILIFLNMANSAGSKKRARQAIKRNQHNSQIRAKVRTFIKKVTYALEAGNKKEAQGGFGAMQKMIDQSVSKGLMNKNQAARKKSRLNTQIKAL
jgi:SSU ribosomal protein S20P